MTTRPNILFIMTDQQRADALGRAGNSIIKTPNLDSLAEGGVRFTQAFTQCSMCIPARFSLITGRYPHSHEVFHLGPMKSDEASIAEILNDEGYRSAVSGKMHFCNADSYHGFEFYAYADRPDTLWDIIDTNSYIDHLKKKGKAVRRSDALPEARAWANEDGKDMEFGDNDYVWWEYEPGIAAEDTHTAFVTDRAIDFLEEKHDKPWMLWVSYFSPHGPYELPGPFDTMYSPEDMVIPDAGGLEIDSKPMRVRKRSGKKTPKQMKERIASYYAQISEVDHHVGRVISRLKELGLYDNTILVFTSDHGDMLGEQQIMDKGPMLYDGVIRVPMIFHYPAKLPQGKVLAPLVASIDIMPTLLELAGVPVPRRIQGQSLAALMNGVATQTKEAIFSEYGQGLTGDKGKMKMVRTEEWKFIYICNDVNELYDLVNDPGELKNLAGRPEYVEVELEMMRKLMDWINETEPHRIPMEKSVLQPISWTKGRGGYPYEY
ncbi:sulfatase [Candidatus Hydrogenedentota bacterium]